MLQALILATAISAFGETDAPIACNFPGADGSQRSIRIDLEPRPSLKDQPGIYRVIMEMNDTSAFRASAKPIATTEQRDIMIRAITKKKSMYTIGLRDDGKAALNIQTRRTDGSEPANSTRIGYCTNFQSYIDKWLQS